MRVQASKLYHLGIRSHGARNTLANATRDWRIYCELGQSLIATARRLYATEPFGLDRKETVYALDATTIDLCLSVFPWAPFRATKAAIKLHTLLELRGNIPSFIFISDGKLHEVNVLDQLVPEPGPSMEWIGAIRTSSAWVDTPPREASLSFAPSAISKPNAATRRRSTDAQA